MDSPGAGRRQASPSMLGDEADLFRDFNPRLVRIVQRRTNAPREIIDDACAYAWQQFLQHQPDRDRGWRAWLVTTAEREAWRLNKVEARNLSLSLEEREYCDAATWDLP
jgi:hypothetical protein